MIHRATSEAFRMPTPQELSDRFRQYREVTKPFVDAKIRIHSQRAARTFSVMDGRFVEAKREFSAEDKANLDMLDRLIKRAHDQIFKPQ